ncbi:MAG: UDP-N-acetylmuramoyl-tripeptide--D-alanyl-D-alanine ligase, partial [Actinomycetota bacterium]|nr:UDP-N-acetylmuramoyl-tripeptide--D-alanyl-D-alanine ligase [Actinomycetota bacterium]
GRGRRIAVLGVMAELGPDAADHHRAIVALAADLGIEVVSVAAPMYGATRAVDDVGAAYELLFGLGPGDAVLVKGSRVAELERLVTQLLAP